MSDVARRPNPAGAAGPPTPMTSDDFKSAAAHALTLARVVARQQAELAAVKAERDQLRQQLDRLHALYLERQRLPPPVEQSADQPEDRPSVAGGREQTP
jgi:hypothetical protein